MITKKYECVENFHTHTICLSYSPYATLLIANIIIMHHFICMLQLFLETKKPATTTTEKHLLYAFLLDKVQQVLLCSWAKFSNCFCITESFQTG